VPVIVPNAVLSPRLASLLAALFAAGGCASVPASARSQEDSSPRRRETASEPAERQIIRNARLHVEVGDVPGAQVEAERIVREAGGFVEGAHTRDQGASLTLRVPAAKLDGVLELLGKLGDEELRSVTAEDVTRQTIDLEARLKSARELRDRLRALLAQAKNVPEILEVERELARVQAEVESMEAFLQSLRQRVALSRIDLELKQSRILGPLGYLFAGLGWAAEKLFVIR